MIRFSYFILCVLLTISATAQRRTSLYQMRNLVDKKTAIVEQELQSFGYIPDEDKTDENIGDWGVRKHYIDEVDTKLSITINKKLGLVKAATIYSTDKLQYQRMLNYIEWANFKKLIDKKKSSTATSDSFTDLWKESFTNHKVIFKYKTAQEQEPFVVEISKDIAYTNLEK